MYRQVILLGILIIINRLLTFKCFSSGKFAPNAHVGCILKKFQTFVVAKLIKRRLIDLVSFFALILI